MSLVEALIGIVVLLIAAIGTLTYFALGLGGVNQQGNKRAALERARQRLEQLMAVAIDTLPADGRRYWCREGNPCASWVASDLPVAQTVSVDELPPQRMETTVQFINDPTTPTPDPETFSLDVKVWFIPDGPDDNFSRVQLRALRTP